MVVQSNLLRAVRRALAVLVVAPVTLVSSPVQAESLMDVYRLAQENDQIFRAGFHEHEASKEIYDQARAVLLPTVKLDISRTDTTQDIVSSDNVVYQSGSTSYPTDEISLSITQSIYSYSNWAYFKQAKEEVKKVAAELEDVRQELILRVAEAYFTALKERDNFIAIEAEVSALDKHYELVQEQRASGLARTTDLLDSQARLMQAQARQIEISNDLRDALQGLQEITGQLPASLVALGESMELVGPQPSIAESWVDNALQNNPLILAKQSEMDAAWQEVRRQRGGHYPTLDLVVSQNNRKTEGSLFGGGSEVDTQDILLKVTMPIYSGGAVSSKVRETINLHNKAKDELEQTKRETAREARAAFTGVTGAISKVVALQRSVDAYELAVEAKRTAFESGVTSSVSVLDAERDLFIARSDFSGARYDYLLNNLRLKRASGTLTEADLEQINAVLQGGEVSTDVDEMQGEAQMSLSAPESNATVRSVVFLNQDAGVATETAYTLTNSVQSAVVKTPVQNKVETEASVAGTAMQADGWLQTQPSDQYVVQLAKGGDEAAVKRYIEKYQLQQQASYYRTQRESGKVVYVVVSQPYNTVAEAKSAMAEMPRGVKKDYWIRKLETLQKNYRQPDREA